jgi:hypothetical protein
VRASHVLLGNRELCAVHIAQFCRSLRHEVAWTTAERGLVHDSALPFAAGILGKQAVGGRRKLLPRVWSLPDNVAKREVRLGNEAGEA